MADSIERYAFIAEWYDPNAAIMKKYQFLFYTADNTIEMFDIKNRRLFLKRSKYENINLSDLFLQATVNVHARQLTITDYADQQTRNALDTDKSRTFAMIKPDAISKVGEILQIIPAEDFLINQMRQVVFTPEQAAEFYKEHEGKPFYNNLISFMTSGPVIGMELLGKNCVTKWRELIGPTNTKVAKQEAPDSIRAKFGTDGSRNACHGSDSSESATREIDLFFGSTVPDSKDLTKSTICIIKPHAVKSGQIGTIISKICEAGFEVSALQMYKVEKTNAEEFYEIYKGVVNEYQEMVNELCNGACVALQVTKPDTDGKSVVNQFREFVGPVDPTVARHLRKGTLRAQLGSDKIKNAVHCTDLEEDGGLEVEYFFKCLAGI